MKKQTKSRWIRSAGRRACAAAALLVAACGAPPQPQRTADRVFLAGAVYTMETAAPHAQALAVAGGRIVFVGDGAGARRWIGDATEVIDLHGRMLLPGFQDCHVHPMAGGVELGDCDLNPLESADAVLDKVAECAAQDHDAAWLRGGGFQLPLFPGGNPTAAMLDAVVPERPVFLTSADGHSAWVNSTALRIAGLSADTPDPKGGRIERDPATGEPSGTLREAAVDLVSRYLPKRRPEELMAGLRRALDMAAGFGITAMQEASAGPDDVAAYDTLARRGELTARVSVSLLAVPGKGLSQVAELVALRDRFNGGRLRVNTVKLFADGVIEGQTAALLEPYIGRGGDRGELLFEPDDLNELVAALDAEGFQVHVHAIGDRAIRATLDAFEHAVEVNGARDSRHHIAHAQLIDPDDIPRFRRLGVYANFQPLWAYADSYIKDLTEPFLGPERSRWLYPIGSVAASGATVVFGSDWSVSSMNPLEGIEVGVTRRDPADASSPAWIPEERVDVETMLAGYTREAARVNFIEGETGTLAVGKAADLVVLGRDLFAIPAEEIGEVPVLLTVLEGEIIYRAAGF